MRIVIALLLIVSLSGCKGNAPADKTAEKQQSSSTSPAGAPPTAQPPSAATPHISVTGTVLERIDVDGGTYLRLKTPQGEIWAAVNKTGVKKGAEVTVVNAVPMDGFESKTLKRKFDRIIFGSLSAGGGPEAGPAPKPAGQGAPTDQKGIIAAQHASVANAPVGTGEIKVNKAEGAEGKTVAEIIGARASLKDASVAVRGKVVKFSPGIMGKNWIHLRDGSGSRAKQDDDITVTTADMAAVGDVVLVRGVVHVDRDFGAGYLYPVIIEDAKVAK